MSEVFANVPPPGLTVGGKTGGPVVSIGRSRVGRGHPLWLHETEVREVVRKFGWPLPETHADVVAELEQAKARIAELEATVTEQAADVQAAEAALRARFATPAKTKGTKAAAKETDPS